MGIRVRERAQRTSLMMEQLIQQQMKRGDDEELLHHKVEGETETEPQLPSGWEKCLDMKSGLMYFKNWNTGTLTYRDPRPHSLSAHHPPTSHRIGLLSISLHPHDTSLLPSVIMSNDLTHQLFPRQSGTTLTHSSAKRKSEHSSPQENCRSAMTIGDHHHHHCLELSLNPPGSSSMSTSTQQQDDSTSSVCTVEKVRSALERSQWSGAAPSLLKKSRLITCGSSSTSGMDYYATSSEISITPLSMNVQPVGLLQPTSSRESITSSLRARLVQSDLEYSKPNSPSLISQCTSSECFTASSSAMSYEGDDEVEVNRQPRSCREPGEATKMDLLHRNPKSVGRLESAGDGEISVMVAVGCKSCLMYVMISKQNPSCPKCGNADDTLLQVPTPLPSKKRQRLKVVLDTTSPSWSWSTA